MIAPLAKSQQPGDVWQPLNPRKSHSVAVTMTPRIRRLTLRAESNPVAGVPIA